VQCDDRHAAAVANTLRWADDAAACGDHADAVSWVETVLAIGDELPEEYAAKRDIWRRKLARERANAQAA
jgi:hypothetical protein